MSLALSACAFAQHGSAPNGYYPPNYQGATFTGEVIEGPLNVLTARYKHGKKEEVFTGRFEAPCVVPTKDGKIGAMAASDVNLGDVVTVYYFGHNGSKDGQRVKENVVIGIVFDVVNGKPVPQERRKFFLCTGFTDLVYKHIRDSAVKDFP